MGHICRLSGTGNRGFRRYCRLDGGLLAAVPRSPRMYDRVPGLVLEAVHRIRLGIPAVLDRAATTIHRDGLTRRRRLRGPRRRVRRRSYRCDHLENLLHGGRRDASHVQAGVVSVESRELRFIALFLAFRRFWLITCCRKNWDSG